MFCTKCGEKIEEDNLFCTKCGTKVGEETNDKQEHQVKNFKNKKTRNILLIILVVILITVVLIFVGSKVSENKVEETEKEKVEENVKNSTIDEHYFNVLEDKEKIKYEIENEEIAELTISEILSKSELSQYLTGKIDYCLLDIDNDKDNEMYLQIELEQEPFIIVLNYEEENIYGFAFPVRGITSLKKDGTYIGSGGSETYGVNKMSFDKDKLIEISIASRDRETYIINDKKTTENEFNKFMEEFNKKEDIQLVEYRGRTDNSNDLNNEKEIIESVENDYKTQYNENQTSTTTTIQNNNKLTDAELSKQKMDSIFVTVNKKQEGSTQYTLYRNGRYYEPSTTEEYQKLDGKPGYYLYESDAYKSGNIFFTIYFDTWVDGTEFKDYKNNKKEYDMDQTVAMGYKVSITNNTTGENKNVKMTDIAGNMSETFYEKGNSFTLVISDKFGNNKTLNFNK